MIMKKILLGLFFLVVLAVLFFLLYQEEKLNLPSPIPAKVTEEKTLIKPKKILDLANGRPSKNLKIKDQSHPCSELINIFSNTSLNETQESVEDIIEFGAKVDCQKDIQSALKGTVIESLKKNCLSSAKNLKSKACENFLINFRAWGINLSFPDDNLAALDETVLINKFLWNFTNNPEFKLDKLDISLGMINEILSRRPDFFAAYKAKLIPLFMKEVKYKQDVEEDLSSTLEALNSLGRDKQVDEFPIVLSLNKENIDEEKSREYINNYFKKHPNSSRGYYYLAALEWKRNKNLSGAKKILKKALRVNPKDEFVQSTLDSIKKSKEGKPTFYFSIDFNFENL